MKILLATILFALAGLSFGLTLGTAVGVISAVIAGVLGLALAQSDKLPMHAWLGVLIPIALLPDFAIGDPSALRAGWCLVLMALVWASAALPVQRLEEQRWGLLLAALLGVGWMMASALSVLKYANFGDILARDAAYYDQIYRSAVLGDGTWRGSILQRLHHDPPLQSHLGVHATPVAYLLWPLYWLFPSLDTLLVGRNAFLFLGGWPMYLLARRRLGKLPAVLVTLAMLGTPTYLYQPLNSFYFYPAAIAPFLWAWYFHEEDKPHWFVLSCLALLMVREDMGIAVAGLGALSLWERWRQPWGEPAPSRWRRRFALGARALMVPLGALWWMGMTAVVMPTAGAAAGAATLSWYAGWSGGLDVVLKNPGFLFTVLFSELKLNYMWQLLRASGGLGVLALPALLGLPYLMINLLVTRPQAATAEITYHYSILIIAALYLAVPRVLESWTAEARKPELRLARRVALAAFVMGMSLSSATLVFSREELSTLRGGPEVELFQQILARIPADDSSVAAPSRLLTGLTADHTLLVASDKPMGYTDLRMDWVVLAVGEGTYYPGDWKPQQWQELFDRFANDPAYDLVMEQGGYRVYRLQARGGGEGLRTINRPLQ